MRPFLRSLIAGLLLVCAYGSRAQAPPSLGPPLHVGTTNRLLDEFGRSLKGVNPAAAAFGFAVVPGEVVQILLVTNAVAPPDANGAPNAQNALLFEGHVGDGMDPGAGQTAMFGFSMPNRPAGGRVVARVFNKPSLAESSFYADSQIFYVASSTDPTPFNQAFIPAFQQTLQPLDTADPDGDGLINSWEKSLGSSTNSADTDGDGMGDVQEWRAGTELTNRLSVLAMVELNPLSSDLTEVKWDSVEGKAYQIEFRPGDLLTSTSAYQAVSAVITALDLSASVVVTNDASPMGHYRVRLVEP